MRQFDVENAGHQSTEYQLVPEVYAGLPERRLLDEIGNLSCDELATALLLSNHHQPPAN